MPGWRARIALISPQGETLERTFNVYAPRGVSTNTTKIWFPGPSVEGLVHLSDQLESAAKIFAGWHHDLAMFGCTSGSLVKGVGFDKECIERLEKASGFPALTTSTAVLEGFDKLGMPSTAVLTPYPDETNAAEKKFREDNGIKVTTIDAIEESPARHRSNTVADGLKQVRRPCIPDLEDTQIYKSVMKMDLSGAQSLFISCAGLDTMEIVEMLETDLGIPVITSCQASLWGALRHCRVGDRMPRYGKLFTL